MVSTRTWRSAVNKVAGIPFVFHPENGRSRRGGRAGLCRRRRRRRPSRAPAAWPLPANASRQSPCQKPLDKPLWTTLTRPQQVALEPLADEWDRMEGVRKQKWLEIANRFASMKPDEQAPRA